MPIQDPVSLRDGGSYKPWFLFLATTKSTHSHHSPRKIYGYIEQAVRQPVRYLEAHGTERILVTARIPLHITRVTYVAPARETIMSETVSPAIRSSSEPPI